MGTLTARALALAAVALSGCASGGAAVSARPAAAAPDAQWTDTVAFVTTAANLVDLTPRTAPARLGALLTLKEIERNEVAWIFEGLPTAKGALQKARLVFSPGEARDEISSIVLTFGAAEAPERARLFDDVERAVTARLGAPRVREGVAGGRSSVRGWGLGTDWQVTLKAGVAPAAETLELSVSVQNEP